MGGAEDPERRQFWTPPHRGLFLERPEKALGSFPEATPRSKVASDFLYLARYMRRPLSEQANQGTQTSNHGCTQMPSASPIPPGRPQVKLPEPPRGLPPILVTRLHPIPTPAGATGVADQGMDGTHTYPHSFLHIPGGINARNCPLANTEERCFPILDSSYRHYARRYDDSVPASTTWTSWPA